VLGDSLRPFKKLKMFSFKFLCFFCQTYRY